MHEIADKYDDLSDVLFKSDTVKVGDKWVKTIDVNGKQRQFIFNSEPAWIKTINKSNEILRRNNDPIGLRKVHDNLYKLAIKADNPISRKFDRKILDNYLIEVNDIQILNDLKLIYGMKAIDEEKSCVTGGSMPSVACSSMRRLSSILTSLSDRIKHVKDSSIKEMNIHHITNSANLKTLNGSTKASYKNNGHQIKSTVVELSV